MKKEINILKNELDIKNKNLDIKTSRQINIMDDNFECPKCHNIVPKQNQIMKDARFTIENPMPLDESRKIKLNQFNLNELDNLKLTLNQKDKEINNLKNQINNLSNNNNLGDENNKLNELISIQFKSLDESIDISFLCKKTSKFIQLEEKLYNKYPEYINYNTYFTINGVEVKRFKTIKDNNIKDSDQIMINIYK